jgi:hypothetical protein
MDRPAGSRGDPLPRPDFLFADGAHGVISGLHLRAPAILESRPVAREHFNDGFFVGPPSGALKFTNLNHYVIEKFKKLQRIFL